MPYEKGVLIYGLLPDCDKKLLELFKKRKSSWTNQRLQNEIKNYYISNNKTKPPQQTKPPEQRQPFADSDIYKAAKIEADNVYKECMNKRALLFKLAEMEEFEDPNTPDNIKAREAITLEVLTLYQQATDLYIKADYIKQTGKIPYEETVFTRTDYNKIPDILVKQQLDNMRKNYGKLKTKKQTPEIIAKIEEHINGIKILNERWLLLKQKI